MKSKKVAAPRVVRVSPLAVNPQAISFSLKEAAAITGLALWAVRSAIWDRQLKAHFVGKRQVILREDLQAWLAATPTAQGRAA
jgi:excisionase family DNA binding protein